MKIIIRLLKITGIALISLIILTSLFKDQIAIALIQKDLSNKAKRPYVTLELRDLPELLFDSLKKDFEAFALPPEDYIIKEFQDHDIIFLGEIHRISHDYKFISQIIPGLYENGIRHLALEFTRNMDSLLIREVLSNPDYFDEKKARQILFNLSPYMGFQELLDIYRAAWELNKDLPPESEKFMIHGIMHATDFSLLTTAMEKEDETIMNAVRFGVTNPEKYMADCILNDFASKNIKVLVYCGIHHAFTGYEGHGDRTGVLVKSSVGDRVMTISLHYPWPGKSGFNSPAVYPANGYIDSFIRRYDSKDKSFGIGVTGNVFGSLTDTTSYYSLSPEFRLEDFCDGYIYLAPFSEIRSVEIIEGFINRDNVKWAKTQLPNPEIRDGVFRFLGHRAFNELTSIDSDLEIRYRHLK